MKSYFLLLMIFFSASTLAQVAENAEDISPLLIGEEIPSTELFSLEKEMVMTDDLFKEKTTVLLFYRGGWCPYCNAHLAAVGEIAEEIQKLGYNLIAVSPDSPATLNEYKEEQELDYQLFSDPNGKLTKAMGLAFKSPARYDSMLSDRSGGENFGFLPVPALFVVNTEGTILFEYISPDYKNRIEAPLLLDVLHFYNNK